MADLHATRLLLCPRAQLPTLISFASPSVGVAVGGICLFTSGYVVPGGANEFLAWAEALVSGATIQGADRDVGFPILLVLSGYTLTGSFIGITLIHAVFAALMPVFIYAALQPFSTSVAYYSGQTANLCLGSFLFIKFIHHDQAYIFTIFLMLMFLSVFLTRGAYKYLYYFTLACIAASICRPAGNLLFPLFLIIAFVAAPRARALPAIYLRLRRTSSYRSSRGVIPMAQVRDFRHAPSGEHTELCGGPGLL